MKTFAAACPSRDWMTKWYYSYTMEYNTVRVHIDTNLIIAMLGETYPLQKIMIMYMYTHTYLYSKLAQHNNSL